MLAGVEKYPIVNRSELGATELPTLPFRPPVRPLDPNTLFYLGLALATGSVLFFILGIYAVVISSYMPETGVWVSRLRSATAALEVTF